MKVLWMANGSKTEEQQSQFANYASNISDKFNVMMLYIQEIDKMSSRVKEFNKNNVTVESINSKSRVSITSIYRSYKVMKKFKPDIIHSHHPIAGVNARVAGLLYKTFHNRKLKIISEQRNAKKGLSKKAQILEAITFPIANLILCSSHGVEKSFFGESKLYSSSSLSSSNRKHYTFYNTIDINKFGEYVNGMDRDGLRKSFGFESDEILTVSVAGFKKQKGHKYIIDSIYYLKNNCNLDVKCLFVGQGPLLDEMKTKVEQLKLLNNIFFLGHREDVHDVLYMSDIFLLASLWEGLPKSLLEAMSLGLPCIATNVEGNSDVLSDGVDGVLIRPEDSRSITEAIIRLVDNPKEKEQIALNATKSIKRFSVEESVKELENIYIILNSR